MKIRTDFVTNSSSSSFIIVKEDITPEQVRQLVNWENLIETEDFRAQSDAFKDYGEFYSESMYVDGNDRVMVLSDSDGHGEIFNEIIKFIGVDDSKIFYTD